MKNSLFDVNKDLIDVAMGRSHADSVIRNGFIVNVFTGEVLKGDIAIKKGRIAIVGELPPEIISNSTNIFDVSGKFIVPGFLDGHVHIESAMVTISQFARGVLPHGTTGAFIDPHEIANVLGINGVKLMIEEGKDAPLRVFVSVPSCVPASSPELETAGAEIGPREIEELMKDESVVALGEVMNYPGVISNEEKMLDEINITLRNNKVVEGHFYGSIQELNAYVSSGISSCHESTNKEIALAKSRLGMYVMVREGSAWRDLKEVIKIVTEQKIDSRRVCLVSDDRHPDDIISEGHMDFIVRRAIEEGVDPIKAIQMATINTAEHFKVDRDVGSVSPGKFADIVVLNDLEKVNVDMVFFDGSLVAKQGRTLIDVNKFRYPEYSRNTMNVKNKLTENDLKIYTKKEKVKINVIKVIEASVLTKKITVEVFSEDGLIKQDIDKDLAKVACVERHKASGEIGLGFVTGFGFKSGAVASTVAHDSHNLLIVGTNDKDMVFAGNKLIEAGGGMIAVENERVLAFVELPIAGLISDEPIEKVAEKVKNLQMAWKKLGCNLIHPFMTMSLLSLSVLPEIRITNKGVVDTVKFKVISLFSD